MHGFKEVYITIPASAHVVPLSRLHIQSRSYEQISLCPSNRVAQSSTISPIIIVARTHVARQSEAVVQDGIAPTKDAGVLPDLVDPTGTQLNSSASTQRTDLRLGASLFQLGGDLHETCE